MSACIACTDAERTKGQHVVHIPGSALTPYNLGTSCHAHTKRHSACRLSVLVCAWHNATRVGKEQAGLTVFVANPNPGPALQDIVLVSIIAVTGYLQNRDRRSAV